MVIGKSIRDFREALALDRKGRSTNPERRGLATQEGGNVEEEQGGGVAQVLRRCDMPTVSVLTASSGWIQSCIVGAMGEAQGHWRRSRSRWQGCTPLQVVVLLLDFLDLCSWF